MTVPVVPYRSLERLERGALPFRAFPLPLGGNVGNALGRVSWNRPVRFHRQRNFSDLTRLRPPDNRIGHART
jgi:hypothetical protein